MKLSRSKICECLHSKYSPYRYRRSSIIFAWALNIKLVKTSETVGTLSHCSWNWSKKSRIVTKQFKTFFGDFQTLVIWVYMKNSIKGLLYLTFSHQLVLKIEMRRVNSITFCLLFIILISISQEETEAYETHSWVLRASCLEIPTGKLVWKILGCDQKRKVVFVPQYSNYLLRFWNKSTE